jgi:hypothetical protein
VDVEVIVNGRVVSKRTQRVNKLFSRGRGAGAPLAWQVWGGSFHMDRWSESGKKTKPAKELAGGPVDVRLRGHAQLGGNRLRL